MFIKCKNCSRTYNVPDEKWQILRPQFFKCTACGEVFEAPKMPDNEKTESETVMPLAEIFNDEHNDNERSDKTNEVELTQTQQEEENIDKLPRGPVFEPVLQKQPVWSKLLVGLTACLITFFCITIMFYIGRICFDKNVLQSSEEQFNDPFIFQNTTFNLTEDMTLSVSSRLVNTSASLQKAPKIIVLLKSKNDIELQREYVVLGQHNIYPKQSVDFHVDMTNIHPDSFKIEIVTEESKK